MATGGGSSGEPASSYEHAFRTARLSMALARTNDEGERAYVEVNRAFADLFGWTPEEMAGMETRRVLHPEDVERSMDELARLTAGLVPTVDYEVRFVRKDGSTFWGAVHASLLPTDDGAPATTVAHVVDIDDRKRGRSQLARSQEELSESQRHANTGSFELTQAGLVLASEQLLRMYGLDRRAGPPSVEQLIERVHPADRDRVREVIRRPDRPGTVEFRYRRDDGRELLLEATTLPDPQGVAGAMRGTVRDVTLRRTLERALDSAERIKAAFDASPVPHVLVEAVPGARRIEYSNEAATRLLGRSAEELVGASLTSLFPERELPPQLAAVLDREAGGPAGLLRVVRGDGRPVEVGAEIRTVPGVRTTERCVLVALQAPVHAAGGRVPELPELTDREVDVLQLVAEGRGGREIAERLHLSSETVKTHLRRIYSKLGVSDRAAAVAVALRAGAIR